MELLMKLIRIFSRNSIFTVNLSAFLISIFTFVLPMMVQAQSCNYPSRLQNKETIQISIFFGYIDQRPDVFVLDPRHSQDLLSRMLSPCGSSRDVVCGFSLVQNSERNISVLEKYFQGKTFQIQVVSSAISDSDDVNSNSSEQLQISSRNFELFNSSLQAADAVLYQGHSRYGYGPDFLNPVLDDQGHVLREYYDSAGFKTKSILVSSLNERADKLPVLGLFSCDSDRHFSSLLKATRKTDFLMLTNDITYSSQLQKPMLQFLHNLLLGQCLSQGIQGFRFY